MSNLPKTIVDVGIFVVLLVAYAYVHQTHFASATPVSRLDALHALFAEKTLRIDAYRNTTDISTWKGHVYSDKAPGTLALALPGFAASAGVLKMRGVDLDSDSGWLVSSWIACVGSNGVLAAIGGVALFAWLSRIVAPKSAMISTLALFLGAAPLPYATMLFSHSLVVGCVAVAVWSIERGREKREGGPTSECEPRQARGGIPEWLRANRWELLAGFACGWALASEYTAGIIVVGLFLWMISTGRRRAIPFCLAALPPLLLVPGYSWVCFGKPLILPYSLNASFPAMKKGLYAIKWPNPATAANLLLTPTRGLFFWTPFLLMAGVGYWKLAQTNVRLFWLTYLVPLLQIVVISGRTWDWAAGNSLGPRYLAPMLPLLALPCALGVQRFPKLGIALAGYSILVTTVATLTDACPPSYLYNPLTELQIPCFLKGEFSPNLGMALGLPSFASVALFYLMLIGGIWWLWWRVSKTPSDHKAETA